MIFPHRYRHLIRLPPASVDKLCNLYLELMDFTSLLCACVASRQSTISRFPSHIPNLHLRVLSSKVHYLLMSTCFARSLLTCSLLSCDTSRRSCDINKGQVARLFGIDVVGDINFHSLCQFLQRRRVVDAERL